MLYCVLVGCVMEIYCAAWNPTVNDILTLDTMRKIQVLQSISIENLLVVQTWGGGIKVDEYISHCRVGKTNSRGWFLAMEVTRRLLWLILFIKFCLATKFDFSNFSNITLALYKDVKFIAERLDQVNIDAVFGLTITKGKII